MLGWVDDGMVVRLDDQTLYLGDMAVAKGTPLTPDLVQAAMTEARAMVGVQIESFAANTLEFLRREHELLTHGIPAPDMDTDMNGRQCWSWCAAITTGKIWPPSGLTSASTSR